MKLNIDFDKNIPQYAQTLKAARVSNKWTQTQVAKQLGISAMGLSFFEAGTRVPRLDTFEKWLDIFGLQLTVDFKKK